VDRSQTGDENIEQVFLTSIQNERNGTLPSILPHNNSASEDMLRLFASVAVLLLALEV
jgi:hypothetical protein